MPRRSNREPIARTAQRLDGLVGLTRTLIPLSQMVAALALPIVLRKAVPPRLADASCRHRAVREGGPPYSWHVRFCPIRQQLVAARRRI